MATCPRGHSSVATDYCDECGTPINAAVQPPPAVAMPAGPPSSTAAGSSSGQVCPDCGTPRNGRFCEVDGYDFEAQTPPTRAPDNAINVPAPPPDGSWLTPVTGTPTSPPPPPVSVPSVQSVPSVPSVPVPPPVSPPVSTPVFNGALRLVVSADRAYHERMAAVDAPDADSVAFPVFCPERRFALSNGQQLLVGRRSISRGIEPNIDLTGPPEDVGVSHAHAVLMSTAEGEWTVVDLGSANGTYLNDSTDPLKANTPTPIKEGDQIHVGAWTTLTLTS